MRILFDFTELPEPLDAMEFQFWIQDFPCRINTDDEFSMEVFPDKYHKYNPDNLVVVCVENIFKKDKHGIYQHVYLLIEQ